ncbi:hypothetical protein LCGC14_2809250 [marine sediment metagenome]|uniref:Uncharacterized protein n=1 Tax=marine sediment metagenome TaxID=412755 RepID=A0A0F9BBQ4_9ZZZZ
MEMSSSNNNKQWEFIKQMFEELVKYQSKQNKRISELEEFMNEIRALLAEE